MKNKIFTVVKCTLIPVVAILAWYFMQFLISFIASIAVSVYVSFIYYTEPDLIQEKILEILNSNIMTIYALAGTLYIALFYLLNRFFDFSGKVNMKNHKINKKQGTLSILIGTFIGVAVNCILNGIVKYLPESWVDANQESVSNAMTGNLFTVLFGTVVLAPIIEELLFRGLLYNGMKKIVMLIPCKNEKSHKVIAIISASIIASCAFGIFHGNILQGLYTGIISIIMIWLYETTGSLMSNIMFHGALNFSGVFASLMTFIFKNNISIIISLAVSAVLIFRIHKISRAEQKADVIGTENAANE